MTRTLYLTFITICFCLFGCNGNKSSSPGPSDPNKNPTKTKDTTKTSDTTKTTDTTKTAYTTTIYTINTGGAGIVYDPNLDIIKSTSSNNFQDGGIQTVAGGNVTVQLLNVANSDISSFTNAVSILYVDFTTTADPILEYVDKDDVAKTIIKYDIHFNKIAGSQGSLVFQCYNSDSYFTDRTITFNTAYIMSKLNATKQTIQRVAVR